MTRRLTSIAVVLAALWAAPAFPQQGATETQAFTAALLTTRGESMQGLTVSAYNKWDFRMEGVAIGLLNITHELKGVQLGLLNIAYANPGWRRIFPIINWGNN